HYLRGVGVKAEERVAICAERGVEMVVGVLAVLKAGGGYVPLDPAYPEERLQFMVEDSAPAVLLTEEHLRERFTGLKDELRIVELGAGIEAGGLEWERNLKTGETGMSARGLAYVIYTSGST